MHIPIQTYTLENLITFIALPIHSHVFPLSPLHPA